MTPEECKLAIENGRAALIGTPTHKTDGGHVYDEYRYHVSGDATDEEILAGLANMVKSSLDNLPGTVYWRILPEVVRRTPSRAHGYCRLVVA